MQHEQKMSSIEAGENALRVLSWNPCYASGSSRLSGAHQPSNGYADASASRSRGLLSIVHGLLSTGLAAMDNPRNRRANELMNTLPSPPFPIIHALLLEPLYVSSFLASFFD